MAEAAKKTSATTTLVIGAVKVPVGLFSTVEKPGKLQEFATAGPSGGALRAQLQAQPVPVEDESDAPAQPVSDPFSDAPAGLAEHLAEPMPEHLRGRELDPVEPLVPNPTIGELSGGSGGALTGVAGEYGQVLVEEDTGEVVLAGNIRRGVRLEDGRFVDCTTELAKIEERTRLDQAEVVGFVDVTHVPRSRVKGCYYVGAGDEKAPRALRIMFEGLKRRRRAALVKLTKRSRQTFGVIAAVGEALMLFELVWSEDFRPAPARATRIQAEVVGEREVEMFCELIDAMAAPPSAVDEMRDDAIALREELRARALVGEVADVIDAQVIEPADELAEQLAASLAQAGVS